MADNINYSYVIVDLETTGVYNNCEVIQIAALSKANGEIFSAYILPSNNIPRKVTELTGLSKSGEKLYYNNVEQKTVPKVIAWQSFLNFLSRHVNVVLIGHNLPFDYRFISNNFMQLNMFNQFKTIVFGLSDTLKLVRQLYPQLRPCKQSDVAAYFGIQPVNAHNAVGDVMTLQLIVQNLPEISVFNNIQNLEEYIHNKEQQKIIKDNKLVLLNVFSGLSKCLIGKLANHNISLQMLQLAFHQNGREGIKYTVANVTTNDRFIDSIYEGLVIRNLNELTF